MKDFYFLHEIEQLNQKNLTLFTNFNNVSFGYFSRSIKQLVDNCTPKEDIIGFYKVGKRNKKPTYYPLYKLSTKIKIIQDPKMPLGYQRMYKNETNQWISPDAFWIRKGICFPIKDIKKAAISDEITIFEGKNTFILEGVFTEKIIKKMGVSFDETIIIGYIQTSYKNFPLYKINESYSHIKVLYDFEQICFYLSPKDCFTKREISYYDLTPIVENEPPGFIYHWNSYSDMDEVNNETTFYYNRKNEEKYRLRFLTDPEFDARKWEEKK